MSDFFDYSNKGYAPPQALPQTKKNYNEKQNILLGAMGRPQATEQTIEVKKDGFGRSV